MYFPKFLEYPGGKIKTLGEISINKLLHEAPTTVVPYVKGRKVRDPKIFTAKKLDKGSYEISARILSDNYKLKWYKLGEVNIPRDIVYAGRSDEKWTKRWESSSIIEELKSKTQQYLRNLKLDL